MYDIVLRVRFVYIPIVYSVRCKPLKFRACIGDSHSEKADDRIRLTCAIEVGIAEIWESGQHVCNVTLVQISDLKKTGYNGKERTQ